MSIHSAIARTKQAAQATRATYMLRPFGVRRGGKPKRQLCLVYGNCQAEPIRALLASSAEFADRYEAVRLPAVHEIRAFHAGRFQSIIRAASIIVAQPIKDGYRGLPLGTNQVLAFARRDCTVIRFQALHYDALYPFQFNLLGDDLLGIAAPITVYHDLRTLCAAAKGLSADAAVRWVSQYRPPEAALHAAAEQAAALIRGRESTTDIPVIDWIIAPAKASAPSFFTVNHPSRLVLQRIAHGVHDILGLTAASDACGEREPLGDYRTPLEQSVIDALGLASEPARGWIIKGKRVSTAHIVRRHLNWYRRRPDLVQAGIEAHAERIAAFGLL
jgi:hypothetical protein